ncbi:MAG TPA: FtsX-like permease family protein [Candidatus Nitrosotalea sp.]|nr:ABC transporter permease [Nitrososphaerota archaeon]HKU33114.1 FtsX-like permease family protein [Candidatus Nitrosotalea sp.]
MNPSDIFSLAYDALVDRKVRTILTVLMVVLGASLVVVINGLSAGQSAFLQKQLSSLASNVIYASSGQRSYYGGESSQASLIVNDVIANKIRTLPYVTDVVPQYSGSVTIDSYGNVQHVSVVGMDPTKLTVMLPNLVFVDGSTLAPNDRSAAVVGDTIANPPGSTTPFVIVGQTLKITYSYSDSTGKQQQEVRNFLVTAIMKPSGNTRIDNALVINSDAANQLLRKSGRYDSLVIQTTDDTYVNTVQQEITGIYGKNIGITIPQAFLQVRQQTAQGNAMFVEMIGFIALVVGAVGIVTTLYNSVTERIREIGTMKAIGAQNSSILALFLVEAALIGVMGATLGLAIGVVGGYAMTSFPSHTAGGPGGFGPGGGSISSFPPIFLPEDLIKVWLLSVSLAVGAGIFPAWKASKLSPMVALRRE